MGSRSVYRGENNKQSTVPPLSTEGSQKSTHQWQILRAGTTESDETIETKNPSMVHSQINRERKKPNITKTQTQTQPKTLELGIDVTATKTTLAKL